MKFPEEYIRHGNFVLHSGQRSPILYDVVKAMTNPFCFDYILNSIPFSGHYVGIATGGALMAIAAHVDAVIPKFSLIRDGEFLGEKPKEDWILLDDVVTTGKSLLEAISLVGNNPEKIIVAVDRRERNENPEVKSIFEP